MIIMTCKTTLNKPTNQSNEGVMTMTNKLTITYQTDKLNEGVMTMTQPTNHQTNEELGLKKELEAIRLVNQIDVDHFRLDALRNYAIEQVKADKEIPLEEATMQTLLIGDQKECVSDVFPLNMGGYGYYGMIHKIGKVEDKVAYRMIAVDLCEGYPIICLHEGLGKLFDYCEDHQGIFFVDHKQTSPATHLAKLVKEQDDLEYAAYGFYDFHHCPRLTQVKVNGDKISIKARRGDNHDPEEFEQAVMDMILLNKIKQDPQAGHFALIMEMIEDYGAEYLFDYYGIKPFCGCQVAEAIESFEDGSEEWHTFFKHALIDHLEAIENEWYDEEEIVDHAFYFSTYLRLEPITLFEVEKLAEALNLYLRWYFEIDLIIEDKKVA